MPLRIIRNNITEVSADALVNTANPKVQIGSGTDKAVYKAAGMDKLFSMRKKIGNIEPGNVAVTRAFRLKAKYIIHAVSPVWQGGDSHEEELLRACYMKSMEEAGKRHCASIAIPLLGSGSNGFPKETALRIALDAIQSFLMDHDMEVILVVFDKDSFALSSRVFKDVASYIQDHQVEELKAVEYARRRENRQINFREEIQFPQAQALSVLNENDDIWNDDFRDEGVREEPAPVQMPQAKESRPRPVHHAVRPEFVPQKPDKFMPKEETFQVKLLKLIDASGETDPDVYKRANIDRKLFAKIRKNENYKPSKKTAIALALALRLSLPEACDLLSRAGFALSYSTTFDLIIRYCFENREYNIFDVNAILFQFDQETL